MTGTSVTSHEDAPAPDDQRETITMLSDPATYGISGEVERIDTHAAIVFLAGERVYKLKRAVRYAYLDHSTPQKRRAVCEAELRLNRRTAPDLYLDVRCVGRRADGTLALGEGEPVDWLVVMRRFDGDCLLNAMAARGGLDPLLIRELADAIARFHAEAPVIEDDGVERVRDVILGNRASMEALPEGTISSEERGQLCEASLAMLDNLAPLLHERAAAGLVRHCHGDLHLANICLWQGKPTLFDCLEFDPALATTDVFYDLAFLVMDLWHRGLQREANLLLNRYCDMRPEDVGLAAMPLFLSMRAAIRAHVGALAAGQQADAEGTARVLGEVRRYMDDALCFLERKPAKLIAVGGLSGTGKSTLAGELAPQIGSAPGARWLRTDVLRKRIRGLVPEQHLPADAYSLEASRQLYHRLIDDTRKLLEAGCSVVLDGVFGIESDRREIEALARVLGVEFCGIWLEAPIEVLRARVDAREGDASDADGAIVELQSRHDVGDVAPWHRLSSAGSRAELLDRALALCPPR